MDLPPIGQTALAALVMLIIGVGGHQRAPGAWRAWSRRLWIGALAALLTLLSSWLIPRFVTRVYYSQRAIASVGGQPIFQGVAYARETLGLPHALVIHVVTIDLDAPGVRFLVTPPDPAGDRELTAQTTSEFLAANALQAAINGDFFEPWRDNGFLDTYPFSGDPVDALGFAASKGVIYSDERADHSTIFISKDNRVTFDDRRYGVHNVLSGNLLFVIDGRPAEGLDAANAYFSTPHPRTAVALDRTGRTLILIVVDGRQPGYSDGATMAELAEIALRRGAWTALNLDGGGSSALVIEGPDGAPQLLSAPIHSGIPYRERPVGNHLGVYARGCGC